MNGNGENLVDFGGVATAGEGADDGFVVDFTDVGDQAAFAAVPRGLYDANVDELTFGMSQSSGNPMWTWKFEIESGEHKGRKLFHHSVFTGASLPRTKKTLAAVCPDILAQGRFDAKQVADSGVMLGRRCRIRIDIKKYEGTDRNNVRDVLPPNAEDGGAGGAGSFLG